MERPPDTWKRHDNCTIFLFPITAFHFILPSLLLISIFLYRLLHSSSSSSSISDHPEFYSSFVFDLKNYGEFQSERVAGFWVEWWSGPSFFRTNGTFDSLQKSMLCTLVLFSCFLFLLFRITTCVSLFFPKIANKCFEMFIINLCNWAEGWDLWNL